MNNKREVVVIGGGLTGLAAAYKLEQHHISYTLIEVKPRLGGSIESVQIDDFVFDSGDMYHEIRNKQAFDSYLDKLGLSDDIIALDDERVRFRNGTGILIDALAAKITAPIMSRMAVSTLGTMGDEFAICMENGMLLDARALIVAAPARHTERMFSTFVPEISEKLRDYPYDDVAFVSLGYDQIKQFSVKKGDKNADTLKNEILGKHHLSEPQAYHVGYWSESHPLNYQNDNHPQLMKAIQSLLPDGVALVGSDYIPTNEPSRLDERIQQGIEAGNTIIEYLKQ